MQRMSKHGAQLQERIGRLSAQIHSATAELVQLAAELDADGEWAEIGVRSCAHWLSINTGVNVHTGGAMIRAGEALKELPRIAAAFADGRLSFDKIRAVTLVATPDEEAMWLDIALHASGAQLTRICRAVRRAVDTDDAQCADDAMARRELRAGWRNDGMLELVALLPREDGAVVLAAIEAAAAAVADERHAVVGRDSSGVDPAHVTCATLRADGLTRVCEQWIASVSKEPAVAPTRQMVVHIDESALAGRDATGRIHVEGGPWLSAQAARWAACDCDRVAVLERDGLPIDVGRAQRTIPPRLRLALHVRDAGCRFPGCSVPPQRTEGHHVWHWFDGGPTDLANLVSMCRFHHRRHHEGKFHVRKLSDGGFRFETSDGVELQPVTCEAAPVPLYWGRSFVPDTPRAHSGGERVNFAYAVSVLADVRAWNRSRHGP